MSVCKEIVWVRAESRGGLSEDGVMTWKEILVTLRLVITLPSLSAMRLPRACVDIGSPEPLKMIGTKRPSEEGHLSSLSSYLSQRVGQGKPWTKQ